MTDLDARSSVVLDAENPWPGLHEFNEGGQSFFNGRERETLELLRLVGNEPLTVLFGGSGLGKTSLLQAGLLPHLREQHLPVYIRLDPRDRGASLIEQAALAFRTQLAAHKVDHPAFVPGESLWEYMHREQLELWSQRNQLLTPVFIFDQFEELFTLGAENIEAVGKLCEDLADLIENRVPGEVAHRLEQSDLQGPRIELRARRCKLILSFREDFLPEVEGWRREIPALLRNRLRLLPMNGEQAFKAVYETGGRLVNETIAREIVGFVAAAHAELKIREFGESGAAIIAGQQQGEAMEQLTIEPALLSLVCTGLNERRKAASKGHIDQELLRGTGRSIISEFYDGSVRDLPLRVRRFIEDALITESGYRNQYPREDALSQGLVTKVELEGLVKSRVLRVEPRLGTDRIELIHDLLTAVVRDFRDQERLRQKREIELQREQKQRWQSVVASVLVFVALVMAGSFWRLWINADEASIKAKKAAEEAVDARQKSEDALKAYITEKERRESAEVEIERTKALEKADADRKHAIGLATQGKYSDALAFLDKSLTRYRELNEFQKIAITLVDIGRMQVLREQYVPAKKSYDEALSMARSMPNEALEGLVLENQAALDEQRGRTTEALQRYSQAQGKYTAAGEGLGSARMLERLATHAEDQSEYDRATTLYREARDVYVVAGDLLGVTRLRKALARTIPWGFLIDLKGAGTYPMRGERIMVGRDVQAQGVKNDLSFSNTFVSRRHLVINHDRLQTDDQRSTNGTAVNAGQIPYGQGVTLNDGDILTLANQEVLQFRTVKSRPASPPSSAWGIFINGGEKDYQYLTDVEYSLAMRNGKLVLEPGFSPSAMLKLRYTDNKVEMFEVEDEWSLLFSSKVRCTEYESCFRYEWSLWPAGKWVEAIDFPSMYTRLSLDGKQIEKEGPSLQVVIIKEKK